MAEIEDDEMIRPTIGEISSPSPGLRGRVTEGSVVSDPGTKVG